MRKIIPLIVLILLSTMFTTAQNVNRADEKVALYYVQANKDAIGISADLIANAKVIFTSEIGRAHV